MIIGSQEEEMEDRELPVDSAWTVELDIMARMNAEQERKTVWGSQAWFL